MSMSARQLTSADSPLFRDEALERFRGSAWQPALLSKPMPTHLLAAFSLAAAAALLGFAATFEFARKEQAQGYLAPAGGWSRVTARTFGVVGQRLVNPGDAVQAGDVLLEIVSGDGVQRAITVQDRMLEEIQGRRAALEARTLLITKEYEQDSALLTSRNESDRGELLRLSEEIQLAEAQVRGARQQHRDAEHLAASGALTRIDAMRLEEELQSRLLSLSERRRAADRLRAALADSETRLERLAVHRDLGQAAVREQVHALAMEASRIRSEGITRVLAPRSGQVASVRLEVGDGVQPGQTLLDIVPPDSVLQGRLFVPPAAMGFVEPGQEVRVYLDAFPYERHGAQSARVVSVSATTLDPGETNLHPLQGSALYRVDVEFPHGFALPPAQLGALRPGMTVTADLVRDYGTLLDWMMEPLQGTARRL